MVKGRNPESGKSEGNSEVKKTRKRAKRPEKLTDKQEQFCREYIIDWNGTQSAIRAGYDKGTARRTATKLLSKDYVKARLRVLREESNKKTQFNRESFMQFLHECAAADPEKCDGKYITSFSHSSKGSSRSSTAKAKAIELLAKHYGVAQDNVNINHTSSDGSMSPKGNLDLSKLSEKELAQYEKLNQKLVE